mgnify:CR=1 FL=1
MNDRGVVDFIVQLQEVENSHTYDIVEGPMADDTIYNYIQNYIDGKISRAAFWELANSVIRHTRSVFIRSLH